jgi:metal-responsive CopG/Arc/MetJ family transcriptional regulator
MYDSCNVMASRQVVFRIPAELAVELGRHLAQTRRKRSDVFRDALRAYLAKATAPVRTHAENVAHLIGSIETRRHVM